MAENRDRWRRLRKKLTSKYRLVIMNDETFEEVSSFRLSRMNVFILFSTILVITVFFTVSAVMFTPLKEYVPGYGDTRVKRVEKKLLHDIDSLEILTRSNDQFLASMRDVINDSIKINKTDSVRSPEAKLPVDTSYLNPGTEEKDFRNDYANTDNLNLSLVQKKVGSKNSLTDFYFIAPVNGYVTLDTVDVAQGHYGVDIVAPENSPIKATLDGKVILSTWTSGEGYVIAIQHDFNLISLYKHNAVLLKKQGDYVNAGDVIAVIGNSGELTTGPHLHFELWMNGIPLDPRDYIIFK